MLQDERGIAMISVILMSTVLFTIAITVMARNIADYNQVRHDRRFEQAIQVADSGVDHTLFKVGATPTYTTGETLPGSFASPEAEEEWVLTESADNPVVTTSEGEWVAIRPQNAAIIYSVGYVPTRANPFRTRIIRAAYDLAPFVPDAAIITAGDLVISGNPTIDGDAGSAHANGDVGLNGDPSFSGYVSGSGDYEVSGSPTIGDPANSGGGKPPREIPIVEPRENYAMSEYDLCPDGTVRTGPSYTAGNGFSANSTGTPCAGQVLADAGAVEYRGWKNSGSSEVDGAKWDMSGNVAYDGVYYVYRGSASVSGAPGSPAIPWNVTILAEALPSAGGEPGHCPHIGGDVIISGNPVMRRHDKAQPLHLIAGRDLKVSGNPGTKYEGVLASHEQFSISGNPDIVGVIIANDYCDTSGSPVNEAGVEVGGNPHITYDGGLEVPLGRRVRTTHWNEL